MSDMPSDGPDGQTQFDVDGRSAARRVEIVGLHLRITGRVELGAFQRVTDLVNSSVGLFRLHDARVLLGDGQSATHTTGDLWVSPAEVTVIAEVEEYRERRTKDVVVINKTATPLAIVTPGHAITGRLYLPPGAALEIFLEQQKPTFLPMTDLRVRSLIDRRLEAEYPFALVSRRHIIAVSQAVEEPPPSSMSPFERLR